MPTYSYRCTACTNAFDIHQAFTDDSLTVCPECGAPLRKVFSAVGVTFQGSGFYRTDSRAESEAAKKTSRPKKDSPDSAPAKTTPKKDTTTSTTPSTTTSTTKSTSAPTSS